MSTNIVRATEFTLASKRTLNNKQVLNDTRHVNSRCHEVAMGNLVPHRVIRHHRCPRAAPSPIPIKDDRHSPVEWQPGKPRIVRIIEVETSPHLPIPVGAPSHDGGTARLVDFCFKLAPAKDKIRLIIEELLLIDPMSPGLVANCQGDLEVAVEAAINFFVRCDNLGKRPHAARSASNCPLSNGLEVWRSVAAAICQFGGSNVFA